MGPNSGEPPEPGVLLQVVVLGRQDGHCEGSPLVEGPGDDRGRPIESRASGRRKAAVQAQVEFC